MPLGNQSSIDKFYSTSWQLYMIPILPLVWQRYLTSRVSRAWLTAPTCSCWLLRSLVYFAFGNSLLVFAFIVFRYLLFYCSYFMLQFTFLPSPSPAFLLRRCCLPRAEFVFTLHLDPRWKWRRWYSPSPATVDWFAWNYPFIIIIVIYLLIYKCNNNIIIYPRRVPLSGVPQTWNTSTQPINTKY